MANLTIPVLSFCPLEIRHWCLDVVTLRKSRRCIPYKIIKIVHRVLYEFGYIFSGKGSPTSLLVLQRHYSLVINNIYYNTLLSEFTITYYHLTSGLIGSTHTHSQNLLFTFTSLIVGLIYFLNRQLEVYKLLVLELRI